LWPAWLVITLVVLAAGALVWVALKSRLGGRWIELARRGAIVALAGVIVLNPQSTAGVKADSQNLDVFLVIDNSISMTAEDYNGDSPRLAGVNQDIEDLLAAHSGARFSVVCFANTASERLGLTTDALAVMSVVETIKPPPEPYAGGTSIDAPLKLMAQVIGRAAEANPGRGRLVYFFSDGEQTRGARVKSFGELKDLVNGGAVFGYGSEQGGRMPASDGLGGPFTLDAQRQAALSRIDQAALAKIADEAGLGYHHRTEPGGVDKLVATGSWTSLPGSTTVQGSRSVAWPAAVVLLGLCLWEVAAAAGWWRRANQLAQRAKVVTK